MDNFIYQEITGLEAIKQSAKTTDRLVYGVSTCWWKVGDPVFTNRDGLPCGPRGEMLLETHEPTEFILQAEQNIEHYGKHGLKAFVAAYHGNVFRKNDLLPTSFETWDEYNALIDIFESWLSYEDLIKKVKKEVIDKQKVINKKGYGH